MDGGDGIDWQRLRENWTRVVSHYNLTRAERIESWAAVKRDPVAAAECFAAMAPGCWLRSTADVNSWYRDV